ncbi:MAG: cation diffusion facilitator family transporter [Spirosomataceae bacterium]
MKATQVNFNFQKIIVSVGILLFGLKVWAWYVTQSVAILTDALESTVNVIMGLFGLYALYLAAQPQDENHPYGHGKIEFLSAAVEGTLISLAGGVIIWESLTRWGMSTLNSEWDTGIFLILITAIVNYILGHLSEKQGKKTGSLALISSGQHLKTDTYSTLGILVGLILMKYTGWKWLDSAIALGFGVFIGWMGYRILRNSIAGIMDEADTQLLDEIVATLEQGRQENWVDIHNLRVIKYGTHLHIDCHLTVPWYLNVHEAHQVLDTMQEIVHDRFGDEVEFFVHTDGCLPLSCGICLKQDCHARQTPFQERIQWKIENVVSNQKHRSQYQ